MIFAEVIKYRNYILVTKTLHLIFLKDSLSRSFFVTGVGTDGGDSSDSVE